MSRKRRIHVPGSLHHVMFRGNNKQNIFFSDEDFNLFYSLIQDAVKKFEFKVHAFCLMTNHVHMAIQISKTPLSKIMHNMESRYSRATNKKLWRQGHLLQNRYKEIMVGDERYLLDLCRYIHLNPVKAKITRHARDYPWSSHRAYLLKETIPWLTTETVMTLFQDRSSGLGIDFDAYVENKDIELNYEAFIIIGDDGKIILNDQIVQSVNKALLENHTDTSSYPLETIINLVCAELNLDVRCLNQRHGNRSFSEARSFIAFLAQKYTDHSHEMLGRRLGRDASTVSSSIYRIQKRIQFNPSLQSKLKRIESLLNLITS